MAWTERDLVTVGYFAKRVFRRPAWLPAPQVEWVCSVADCQCEGGASPPGWQQHWLHDPELFLFPDLATLERVLPIEPAQPFLRFGLRAVPVWFGTAGDTPLLHEPPRAAPIPPHFLRLGYDVCNRCGTSSLEASPLSCNHLAGMLGANRWCLFDRLEQALSAAQRFAATGSPEPGRYIVLEVWAERLPEPAQPSRDASTTTALP